ncbi:thiamine-phosphate kinase [Immundisolibacter sp.]|uniref:thiamine-phosphate kinase n=1 Tax=Immundisolibacter sp. TaxID=1934948 RepID=UPI00261C2607|nr:thiamine-phosphate kinase [Immundisolibacter sp.]MDD3650292.1 thiamine-phosphate kinase [Immundisolibacter sp.]
MPGEFELIASHFARLTPPRGDVALGVGDDAALLVPAPGQELVVTVDTLIEGVHFFADCPPAALGHKALAVNLSDLAAMGAEPAWALLALTLPRADEGWLADFARGFSDLACRHGVALVGGDTCRGPLVVSVTALGQAPTGQALRRAGAKPGDGVYVSGELGAAGLAVRARRSQITLPAALAQHAAQRLDWPQPRLALGLALRGLASAAIDVSDGLLADLGHVCAAGGVGARLDLAALPLPEGALALASHEELLGAGDDYELCFTVPASNEARVPELAQRLGLALTRIGRIEAEPGLRLVDTAGEEHAVAAKGHDHFR